MTSFVEESVDKYGRSFVASVLPMDVPRGDVGKCFDWCALQTARLWPKYRYVEGYATQPNGGGRIYHAWLTDGIHAFDPTWAAFNDSGVEYPVPSEYVGIILPFPRVADFMRATKYQGVLGNAWRAPGIVTSMLDELNKETVK